MFYEISTMAKPTAYELQQLRIAKSKGFSFFTIKGEGNEPAFVYSVGMAAQGLPDVLMFLDSEYITPQVNMLTQFLNHLLEGRKRFTGEALTASLNGHTKVVSNPEIEYRFDVLCPNDNDFAVSNYACRSHFFRRILGDPTICVVSSDFNPTLSKVRQLTVK